MAKLEWLGIFSHEPVGLKDATPAQILQSILEKKWTMRPIGQGHDCDVAQGGLSAQRAEDSY
jgi:hypothetical protein